MTRRKRINNPWRPYMAGNVGDSGFYITTNNDIKYGPFKTSEVAEFFNLIAFCNPRSLDLADDSKDGIQYYDELDDGDHPSNLLLGSSSFAIWWSDTFGIPLTAELIMGLAKESGAKGYTSFTEWLLAGCQINGQSVYTLIN